MIAKALSAGFHLVTQRARPRPVTALSNVSETDTGLASSLLNIGQQIGGSIGLAVLGTVAWSAVATSLRQHAAGAAHTAPSLIHARALEFGFARGFEVAAGIALLAALVVVVMIRPRRTSAMPEPASLA